MPVNYGSVNLSLENSQLDYVSMRKSEAKKKELLEHVGKAKKKHHDKMSAADASFTREMREISQAKINVLQLCETVLNDLASVDALKEHSALNHAIYQKSDSRLFGRFFGSKSDTYNLVEEVLKHLSSLRLETGLDTVAFADGGLERRLLGS